jgi:hypothetical protein
MLIRTPDSIGFGGACCSELILTRCKNKSYSLRACLDQYSDGGRTYYDSIKGIRTPAQFLTALEEVMASDFTMFSDYFTNYEILEKLYEHYPALAVLAHRWDDLDRDSEESIQTFNLIAPLIEISKVNWPATFTSGNTLAGILHHFALDWFCRFGALPCGVHDIMGQNIIFGRCRENYRISASAFKKINIKLKMAEE